MDRHMNTTKEDRIMTIEWIELEVIEALPLELVEAIVEAQEGAQE